MCEAAWPKIRIGDLGEVFTGRTPPTEHPAFFGDDYPFITPGDMHQGKYARATQRSVSHQGAELLKRIQVPANSVCVSCIGWQMGEVIMTDKPSFTNQQINTIVPNGKVEPSFLYYSLRPRKQELLSLGATTGVRTPILNKSAFCDLKVKIPPLPLQRRIAGILSAYDEMIENNQRRIKILEEMARVLYREWFVNFRFPAHEKVLLVDSPLGAIPKGWVVKMVGEVAETFRGRSYRSVDLAQEGGVPFLNLKCLDRDGGFRRSGLKRYRGEYGDTHVAKKGDIVIAVTDMTQERRIVARAASVPTLGEDIGVFSMDLVRVEPRPPMPKSFLYCFLRFSSFADEVKQHANGANVLHLSPDRIRDYRFAVPTSELMFRFASLVGPSMELMDTLENQNENLRCTRDLLLPRLLSGQLDLKKQKYA
jgi:type I restriction enzyme S subunit